MIEQVADSIDPGTAALVGALIGAGASVVVQIVAAVVMSKHESRKFQRQLLKENVANLTEAYGFALNIIYNMQRGGNPVREARGEVFAKISLQGSPKVVSLVQEFLDASNTEHKDMNIENIIHAMQEHLMQLEQEIN